MKKYEYEQDGKKFLSPVFIINTAFTNEQCDAIIETFGSNNKLESAKHAQHPEGGEPGITIHSDVRTSSVLFIEDQRIEQVLFNHMKMANFHLEMNYKITGSEAAQFTKYCGKQKGHYTWHQDGEPNYDSARVPVFGQTKNLFETSEPYLAGTVRKISMSVILNDDFEGGEMQFRYHKYVNNQNPCVDQIDTFKPVKGQAIVFASDLWHCVKPVTKGERYSLVKWFAGPPLK